MQVDLAAMWQGVGDAIDVGDIDQRTFDMLWDAIAPHLTTNSVGRRQIEYATLLTVMAGVDLPWYVWARIWRRLGTSLASGISVSGGKR